MDDVQKTLDPAKLHARPFINSGFDHERKGWVFPRPINAHAHFRDPDEEWDLFDIVLPETVKIYSWAVGMPNLLKNRIRTYGQARVYRNRILDRASLVRRPFGVVVPFYVEEGLDLRALESAFATKELRAGKLYSKNATTGSSWGVDFRFIENLFPLFKLMERYDTILLIHAELVNYQNGRLIPDRLREQRAIAVIECILQMFPKLRIVFEHLSSRFSVAAVKSWQSQGYQVEATVAPQYLLWDQTALFEGGMNPVRFSIPILKDYADQQALVRFVVQGGGMLGTDTAPHNVWKKSQPLGCPGGVFNEPVSIHAYFHVFRQHGGADWFEKFVDFACYKAARFYKLPPSNENVLMVEEPWTVPKVYQNEGAKVLSAVIPMLAGEEIPTTLRAA